MQPLIPGNTNSVTPLQGAALEKPKAEGAEKNAMIKNEAVTAPLRRQTVIGELPDLPPLPSLPSEKSGMAELEKAYTSKLTRPTINNKKSEKAASDVTFVKIGETFNTALDETISKKSQRKEILIEKPHEEAVEKKEKLELPDVINQGVIKPTGAKEFSYDWNIKGKKATGDQLLKFASSGVSKPSKSDPTFLTSLHELYSKAADQFEVEGNFSEAFKTRALAAEHSVPGPDSKLYNMGSAVAEGEKKQWSAGSGAYFSGLGTGELKGGSVVAYNRTIDGSKMTQIEFKLSKFARTDLQKHLQNMEGNLEEFQKNLPKELAGHKVTIKEANEKFLIKKEGEFSQSNTYTPGKKTDPPKALEIEFEGIGSVIVGNSPDYECFYKNVKVFVHQADDGKALAQVHQMLTMLGVGPIMNAQRPEDDERLKLAVLFRAYFPKEAVKMERTKEFYEISVKDLKGEMLRAAPEMANVLKKYDKQPELLKKVETFSGKSVWSIQDISTQLEGKGVYGLIAGVGHQRKEVAADLIISILKEGLKSKQVRYQEGKAEKGSLSPVTDIIAGSGNETFSRFMTHKTIDTTFGKGIPGEGNFQILSGLEAVNVGFYAYDHDTYGAKNPEYTDAKSSYQDYENRDNCIEIADKIQELTTIEGGANEVMIKEIINPTHFRRILCQDSTYKDILVKKMNDQGMVVKGKYKGIPIDDFIIVRNKMIPTDWDKPVENKSVTDKMKSKLFGKK